eukprot:365325-Chlamydomonas_euryale.AAC.30
MPSAAALVHMHEVPLRRRQACARSLPLVRERAGKGQAQRSCGSHDVRQRRLRLCHRGHHAEASDTRRKQHDELDVVPSAPSGAWCGGRWDWLPSCSRCSMDPRRARRSCSGATSCMSPAAPLPRAGAHAPLHGTERARSRERASRGAGRSLARAPPATAAARSGMILHSVLALGRPARRSWTVPAFAGGGSMTAPRGSSSAQAPCGAGAWLPEQLLLLGRPGSRPEWTRGAWRCWFVQRQWRRDFNLQVAVWKARRRRGVEASWHGAAWQERGPGMHIGRQAVCVRQGTVPRHAWGKTGKSKSVNTKTTGQVSSTPKLSAGEAGRKGGGHGGGAGALPRCPMNALPFPAWSAQPSAGTGRASRVVEPQSGAGASW